eukprot:PhM_4_TR16259/c0_g1_i1/m.87172
MSTRCTWSTHETPARCKSRCGEYALYQQNADCDGDVECFALQDNRAVCVQGCGLRGLNSKDACEKSPECEWSVKGETCVNRHCLHPDASGCKADSNCKWSDKDKCGKACSVNEVSFLCNSDDMCRWDWDASSCFSQCEYYSMGSNCTADTTCHWDVEGQYCSLKCENRGLSQISYCNREKQCSWDFEKGVCGERACKAHTSSGCAQMTGQNCEWFTTTTSTHSVDLSITAEQECVTVDISQYMNCQVEKYRQEAVGMQGDHDFVVSVFLGDTCSKCPWDGRTQVTRCGSSDAKHCHTGAELKWSKFPVMDCASGIGKASKYALQLNDKTLSVYVLDKTSHVRPAKIILELTCPGACLRPCEHENP